MNTDDYLLRVKAEPRSSYPIEVSSADPNEDFVRLYSVEEAEELISRLERAVTAAEDALRGPLVRVVYLDSGSSREYTYRDPSGSLRVGDIVEAPVGWGNSPKLAKVVGLGSDYRGEVKEVTARLQREEL